MTLAGRRVVLGVSGGIACYKACTIARRLAESGAAVDVVLTASAQEFVRPVTFEALSGRPVLTSLWERGRALSHIDLPHGADLVILAPATANLVARLAHGLADDLLTTIMLANEAPVLIAPAMNDRMYAHPATQANLAMLHERGWLVIGPDVGPLAEGPSERPGRMVEPEEIMLHAERLIRSAESKLNGKRVVVTAGPTREYLDPVRVVTNPSSGRMGYAVAEAAFVRGADVILISGPTALGVPAGVRTDWVETTAEMKESVERSVGRADLLVMAAAPADFRPRERRGDKVPRSGGGLSVDLEPTEDILASTVRRRAKGALAVGFALESGAGMDSAREKLRRKKLDLMVLNSATDPEGGFESETNRATLVTERDAEELGVLPKREVAERILDRVEAMM